MIVQEINIASITVNVEVSQQTTANVYKAANTRPKLSTEWLFTWQKPAVPALGPLLPYSDCPVSLGTRLYVNLHAAHAQNIH